MMNDNWPLKPREDTETTFREATQKEAKVPSLESYFRLSIEMAEEHLAMPYYTNISILNPKSSTILLVDVAAIYHRIR